jgi:hypothetical protein
LANSINKSKVTKFKILNPPRNDWINKDIIHKINERNELWVIYKTNPDNEEIKRNFLMKRSEVNSVIQKTKREYYYKAFKECTYKAGKMWKLINDLARNKIKENSITSKLLTRERHTITEARAICECFNDFFSNIGSVLANQIPKVEQNLIVKSTSETGGDAVSHWVPVTANEVDKIISSLKINSAAGLDGINTKCIKSIKCANELSRCINNCLESGVFPETLKVAKVTPIYKSGNRSGPENYRPI